VFHSQVRQANAIPSTPRPRRTLGRRPNVLGDAAGEGMSAREYIVAAVTQWWCFGRVQPARDIRRRRVGRYGRHVGRSSTGGTPRVAMLAAFRIVASTPGLCGERLDCAACAPGCCHPPQRRCSRYSVRCRHSAGACDDHDQARGGEPSMPGNTRIRLVLSSSRPAAPTRRLCRRLRGWGAADRSTAC
jgi:hypothetical protein